MEARLAELQVLLPQLAARCAYIKVRAGVLLLLCSRRSGALVTVRLLWHTLSAHLPASPLPRRQPSTLAALLRDPAGALVPRLIALVDLLPGCDVGAVAAAEPELLLLRPLEAVRGDVARLGQLLGPATDLGRLVQRQPRFLDAELVRCALPRRSLLLPQARRSIHRCSWQGLEAGAALLRWPAAGAAGTTRLCALPLVSPRPAAIHPLARLPAMPHPAPPTPQRGAGGAAAPHAGRGRRGHAAGRPVLAAARGARAQPPGRRPRLVTECASLLAAACPLRPLCAPLPLIRPANQHLPRRLFS